METLEQFRERCRAAGLSLTHQREIIFQALCEARNHPSPEIIFEKVRTQIPSISLGTVYKNLKTFMDAGLVREVSLHHGTLRLETNLEPHHHLVCTNCRAILDVAHADVDPVRMKRKPPKGFRVEGYSLEFYGLCPECARQTGPLF